MVNVYFVKNKTMIFQCPLCGGFLEKNEEELSDGQQFLNKRNRSFKSYCEIYDREVTCRQYEE